MRLEQLQLFLAVLECGSIREAARRVGLSQPALSKSLSQLERELDVRLFVRSRQGIQATTAGLTLAVRARTVAAELRKVREELAHGYTSGAAQVAFGVGQASAMLIMSEAIQRFRKRWPQARIRITEGLPDSLLPLIRDETLDFALGGRVEQLPFNVAFKPLFRSARVVVGRKHHPMASAKSVHDLMGAEWVRTPPIEKPNGPLERFFLSAGLPIPEAVVECESYHSATFLLANTDMLALMSRRQLDTPYGKQYLQAIPVRESIPPFTVGMYTRGDTPLTPAAAALARHVTTVARRLSSTREG